MLTNVLLSIGFSLVTNFANVVGIPQGEVPTRVEDLSRYRVGSPSWPADLVLFHNQGARFDIRHGVVTYYESPHSYVRSSDARKADKFRGTVAVSREEAIGVAEHTVRRLARRGNPLAGLRPAVELLTGSFKTASEVPFYLVCWPNPEVGDPSPVDVEIDARNGQITRLFLGDYAFYDLAFSWEIKKRVCVPDPPSSQESALQKNALSALPRPSADQVANAITNWLWLCRGLGLDPGNATNLAAVNWSSTGIYTNLWISPTSLVCRVTFTNRSWFEVVDGVAYSSFSPDSCYINQWGARTAEEWFLFEGKIAHRWGDLVGNLEHRLQAELRIPKALLANYGVELRNTKVPEVGETGLKRVLVNWTNGAPQKIEYRQGGTWAWDNHLGFSAEFDVETGELKFFRFCDPIIIQALGGAQRDSH